MALVAPSAPCSLAYENRRFRQVRKCRRLIVCSGLIQPDWHPENEAEESPSVATPSRTVTIAWDLDSKPPPRGMSPATAAMNIRQVAGCFGFVRYLKALVRKICYDGDPPVAPRHSARMIFEYLEKQTFPEAFQCRLCGRRCKSADKLWWHFKIHDHERNRKATRLTQLKGVQHAWYEEMLDAEDWKYQFARSKMLSETRPYYTKPHRMRSAEETIFNTVKNLREAGIDTAYVRDKADPAVWLLKNSIEAAAAENSSSAGCICIVSDDPALVDALRIARTNRWRAIVIGSNPNSPLINYADAWLQWRHVAIGQGMREAGEFARRWLGQDLLARELLNAQREGDYRYRYCDPQADSNSAKPQQKVIDTSFNFDPPRSS